MKFKKINYIELQMSGDEFDDLISILEIISGEIISDLYPERRTQFKNQADKLLDNIKISMEKNEVEGQ